MCENCNDPAYIAGFAHRNLLTGGAGLAAAPFIAAASSPAYAQAASAKDGSRQTSVRAFGNGGPIERRRKSPDRRTGDWQFQWFNPDRSVRVSEKLGRCQSCHQPQSENDFVCMYGRMAAH